MPGRARFLTLTRGLRLAGLLSLTLLLVLTGHRRTAIQAQDGPSRSESPIAFGMALIRGYSEALDDRSRSGIGQSIAQAGVAAHDRSATVMFRSALTSEQIRDRLAEADRRSEHAAQQMKSALDGLPDVVELNADRPANVDRQISAPFRSRVLLLRRRSSEGTPLAYMWKKVELAPGRQITVDLPSPSNFLLALELLNPLEGSSQFALSLKSDSTLVADIGLRITVPGVIPFQAKIVEGDQPTDAAVGFYSAEGRLLVPDTALDFSAGGYGYTSARDREHINAKFWPGGEGFTRCFMVRGGFELKVPAHQYRMIVSKGPEYIPVDRTFTVSSGGANSERVELKRWIDMSARGWHSGDCHIHYAREDKEANKRLIEWTQAEDLRMGNILRMGDARETFFEQYAWGRGGRYRNESGALVPGQEDPRTSLLGHTISLNIPAAIRATERYYLYGNIFDETRRRGGLAGYAHANDGNFLVDRDMSLNIPRAKVDFAEICEFGGVGTELYYEFLNLGFRLTATAGSDVPWGVAGGTSVGDSRVYVFTGRKFDADEWFSALKQGRTFVTVGPMLEFTVDGRPPGEQLNPKEGQRLKVHASVRAGTEFVPLGRLEIVANGEVIRSAAPSNKTAVLDFELPADRSMWIAARSAGAHTTPVYVTVNGRRHWKTPAVPQLIAKRLRALDGIEKLLSEDAETIGKGHRGNWESANALLGGSRELLKMIQEARQVYAQMRSEWESTH